MSLLAAQALESKLVSLVNSSPFQQRKNILQFHKHRQIWHRSTYRRHLLRHQKIDKGIRQLLCFWSGGIAVLELVITRTIRASHPRFSFHRLCKIFLACRTTRQTNPMGSYSQLTVDRIPCLVCGWWGSRTLDKKASFSTSHCTSSVLSTGWFSRSKSTVGFTWSASGILDSTSWLLLIHFVSLNRALLRITRGFDNIQRRETRFSYYWVYIGCKLCHHSVSCRCGKWYTTRLANSIGR